jgi:PAS domain S-box-containing protein
VLAANANAGRILGLTRAQLAGREPPPEGWRRLDEQGNPTAHAGAEVKQTGRPVSRRGIVETPDGRRRWVALSTRPLTASALVTTFSDVTDEVSRHARELDEARLQGLEERLNEIELVVRRDGTIVHANDHAVRTYGYSREALLALDIRQLREPSTVPEVEGQLDIAVTQGLRFETTHRRRDGSTFPVEVSSRAFEVAGVRYLHSLVRDLTEPKRLEAELRAAQAQATAALRERELVLANSPLGISQVRGRVQIWANRRMGELFGVPPEALLQVPTRGFYLDDADYERVGREAKQVLDAGLPWAGELQLRRADGTAFWCRLQGRPLEAEDEAIWSFEDITERKAAEAALTESEARFRLMADSAPVLIWLAGLDQGCFWFNRPWLQFTGRTLAQEQGNGWAEGVHPDDLPRCLETYVGCFERREAFRMEYRLRRHDGAWRWILDHGVPRTDEEGRFSGFIGSCIDVTEAREARERAEALAREQDVLLQTAQVGIVKVVGTRQVWVNRKMAQLFQYAPDELVGASPRLLFQDDAAWEVFLDAATPVVARGHGYQREVELVRRDGSRLWVSLNGLAIDPTHRGAGTLWVLEDVTERRAEQARLEERGVQLRSIFTAMAEGVLLLDARGHVLRANEAAVRMLGLTPAQREGAVPFDQGWCAVQEGHVPFAPEAQPARVALRTGHPVAGVVMGLLDAAGAERWVSVSAEPLTSALQLRPHGVVMTVADITELRRGQQTLRDREAKLERVLTGSDSGFFDWEVERGVIEHSPRLLQLLGLAQESTTVEGWLERVHPDDAGRLGQHLGEVASGASPALDVEFRVRAGDSQCRWLHGRARRLESGPGVRVSGTLTDISARRDAQAGLEQALARNERLVVELQAATEAAQAASRLKGQFLANMSHEIRTPLNAVLGLARLSLEEPSVPKVHEYLELIHGAGVGLLGLVNDILDFSKIEAGRLTVEQVPFDLHRLLDEVVHTFEIAAEGKGLVLKLARASGVPRVVVGDPLRVRQILNNLLSNALKFTEGGRIDVAVSAGEGTSLCFEVCDTGIGITTEQLGRLFEPFTQADASTTRRFGGTGLGLAISRTLARLMGGELSACSSAGAGAVFKLVCPLPEASSAQTRSLAPSRRAEVPDRIKGKRVLVAEDNSVNQLLARVLLQKAGVEVTLVGDGQQAVDAVLAAPAAFDAVLMDIQMPVLDGFGATEAICGRLGSAAPPIIAVTANAMAEQRQAVLESGMVDHVTKPIDPEALYAVLARVVR